MRPLGSTQRPDPAETIDQALERLRLDGAIYLRAEYSEAWALDGQGGPFIAGVLRPGAERLVGACAAGPVVLSTSDLGVASIARRVGYESEEAFSRAFKRARGTSPAQWRTARRSNTL